MASDKVIRDYESAFASWLGARHAVSFWQGRVAEYAILRAMGIGEGDEVILSGYTCVAVPNPIKHVGATPVYVDIVPATYNMDPDKIEAAITARTRLIIVQHTYGIPAEIDSIQAIADRHGIPVIEDACMAVGSTYHGRKVGTFGLAAYWSMQWNKTFTTGFGGIVTTSDPELAQKIEQVWLDCMQAPSIKAKVLLAMMRLAHRLLVFPRTKRFMEGTYRWLTEAGLMGFNPPVREHLQAGAINLKRLGPGQAKAGIRELARLESNIEHRHELTALYDSLLREIGWPVPVTPSYCQSVLGRFPVRGADKPRARAEASRNLVELGSWFECPLHPIETPLAAYDYHEGMCPESEKASREVVNLPLHRRVTQDVARKCVKLLQEIGPADA